ncbi:MAG: hypothetical protein HW389_3794 [Bacteroidetes bacterium]|nr:hypothetical protein [Bacteroidota bacterium]
MTLTGVNNTDSNADGVWDGQEDFDSDALSNCDEFILRTDPFRSNAVRPTIVSPLTGTTKGGLMTVIVSVDNAERMSNLTLYVDDQPVRTRGAAVGEFIVNTPHFPNGVHTLIAKAADNVGISYLGGNPDSLVVVNELSAAPVTVSFQNSLRWLEPDTFFETDVPISAETDTFPSSWTVFVQDANNQIIRTFSGSTSDGRILTQWDGNDNSGTPVPEDAAYRIVLAQGNPIAPYTFVQMAASPPPTPSQADTVVWKERSWSSGQIILARQRYKSVLVGSTFNAALATMLNGVAMLIEGATAEVGVGREVYQSSAIVCDNNNSYPALLTALSQSEVRDFYYHGHSNGKSIWFSEFTPTVGLKHNEIATSLLNLFSPASASDPRVIFEFRKPFRFVFVDGCQSANGEFPEAFGIPKTKFSRTFIEANKKRRAFMGWATTTRNSIANNDFHLWTKVFWESWLQEPDYNIRLGDAIQAAKFRIAHV